MSEEKPKIRIKEIIENPNSHAICVGFEFDIGSTGYMNFTPEQFESLDVEQLLKDEYERQAAKVHEKPSVKDKINSLKDKKITW